VLLSIAVGFGWRFAAELRALRLLRASRVSARYLPSVRKLLVLNKIELSGSTRRMVFVIFRMFAISHIVACVWFYIGSSGVAGTKWQFTPVTRGDFTFDACQTDPTCSWVAYDGLAMVGTSVWRRYLRSLYFSFNVLTTLGYADIQGFTATESIFNFLWIWLGAWYLFYGAIGAFAAAAAASGAATGAAQGRMRDLRTYADQVKLPRELLKRLEATVRYEFEHDNGLNEAEALSVLPVPLREEIALFIHSKAARSIDMLSSINSEALRSVTLLFRQQFHMPDDLIVTSGDMTGSLFVVVSGCTEVLKPDMATYLGALCEGTCFGESSFFETGAHSVVIRAATFVELSTLAAPDLADLAARFPAMLNTLKEASRRIRARDAKVDRAVAQNHGAPKIKSIIERTQRLLPLRPAPWGTIFPNAPLKAGWDTLLLVVTVWNMYVWPLRLAFGAPVGDWSVALDAATDVLLIANVYLKAVHFAFSDRGVIVAERHLITAQYLRRPGELCVDVLSAIPLFIPDASAPTMCALRVLRLLRVPEVPVLVEAFVTRMVNSRFGANVNVLRLLNFLFQIISVSHWLACGFWFLADSHSREDPDTWAARERLLDLPHPIRQYTRAMYWAVTSVTALPHGDVTPSSSEETLWCFVLMGFAFVLLPSVLGSMATMLRDLNHAAAELEQSLEAFVTFSDLEGLPRRLRRRARMWLLLNAAHASVNPDKTFDRCGAVSERGGEGGLAGVQVAVRGGAND
jgi:CRP-like cAMP-binding protein